MNAASDYSYTIGADITAAAGVALSGGVIFNALNVNNSDAVIAEIKTLDVCMSHPNSAGQLHYHYWSGCLVKDYGLWSDSAAPQKCKDYT